MKKKGKKDKQEDKDDPLDDFLNKFVPPTLEDIPTPDLETEKSETSTEQLRETQNKEDEKQTTSQKLPRPTLKKGPITSRPPAPRPLPISTKEKKKYSSPLLTTKTKLTPIIQTKDEKQKTVQIQDQIVSKKQESRVRGQLLQKLEAETNLLRYFEDRAKTILDRPTIQGWPWVKSKRMMIPPKLVTQWKTEGSLFAAIASLEFYHHQQSKGVISQDVYHRQLKSLLTEALQLLIRLEKSDQFSFESFIEQERIDNYFPQGLEKLRLAEGSSDLDSLIDGQKINYQELVKLPTKAADFVANGIELMDLIRLKAIATIDRILPLLDEMQGILRISDNIFGKDYWALAEINAWRRKLEKEDPGSLLQDKDLEKLEMQAIRWMNDFRRELKNI